MSQLPEIFEVFMVVLFGVSWPASIIKSYRSRTTKGKSLAFLCLIFFGYIFGVASKLISGNIKYVVFFYILNTLMVGTDICLYFRNKRLDMQKGGQ